MKSGKNSAPDSAPGLAKLSAKPSASPSAHGSAHESSQGSAQGSAWPLTLAEAPSPYRGRFAPSPSGALHFGSLVAALASYADARAAGGEWLLRVENLDPPRELPGAADQILHTLETFGFAWDGPVLYQSDRFAFYREISEGLKQQGLAYPCSCSRKQLAAIARHGIEGPIYPGSCRGAGLLDRPNRALRLLTEEAPILFCDRIQGLIEQSVQREFGDFVIRRADGLFAYQLAVVVDDWQQGINHIVRGCDLLHSTSRQIQLQRCLGVQTPNYAHLPLALDGQGRKLSKSAADLPLDPANPLPALRAAWRFLRQAPLPAEIERLDEFWAWALANWSLAHVPALIEQLAEQLAARDSWVATDVSQ
jgi:glutamyl-Q tRNA(Asp) synthetase